MVASPRTNVCSHSTRTRKCPDQPSGELFASAGGGHDIPLSLVGVDRLPEQRRRLAGSSGRDDPREDGARVPLIVEVVAAVREVDGLPCQALRPREVPTVGQDHRLGHPPPEAERQRQVGAQRGKHTLLSDPEKLVPAPLEEPFGLGGVVGDELNEAAGEVDGGRPRRPSQVLERHGGPFEDPPRFVEPAGHGEQDRRLGLEHPAPAGGLLLERGEPAERLGHRQWAERVRHREHLLGQALLAGVSGSAGVLDRSFGVDGHLRVSGGHPWRAQPEPGTLGPGPGRHRPTRTPGSACPRPAPPPPRCLPDPS
jgi:hypothetical protein